MIGMEVEFLLKYQEPLTRIVIDDVKGLDEWITTKSRTLKLRSYRMLLESVMRFLRCL